MKSDYHQYPNESIHVKNEQNSPTGTDDFSHGRVLQICLKGTDDIPHGYCQDIVIISCYCLSSKQVLHILKNGGHVLQKLDSLSFPLVFDEVFKRPLRKSNHEHRDSVIDWRSYRFNEKTLFYLDKKQPIALQNLQFIFSQVERFFYSGFSYFTDPLGS